MVILVLVGVESSKSGGNIIVPHLGLQSLSQCIAVTQKEKRHLQSTKVLHLSTRSCVKLHL